MLAFPFPYIANTVGWMTAELGRQPWLVYGLFRTQNGMSSVVTSGSAVFTLIGFCGLYFVLGLLFLYLGERSIISGRRKRRALRCQWEPRAHLSNAKTNRTISHLSLLLS
jgi:cytochrome d ubiquinol oxidase subunit I